ncbi:MAG TPA: twin-arginine translocase subunit TatC [Thermoplasmata archaeon]|nr:twin-arginine translocase subunit TatC [Thermoplasmata archaeon]
MATLASDENRADDRKMSFFEHLEELRNRLKIVIIAFIAAFLIMLTFTVEPVMVASTTVWLPVPTFDQGNTIPAQVIVLLNHSLVRGSAELIIVTPWEAVIVQLKVAVFLAVILVSPLVTYEFWRFVSPALKPTERRLLFRISAPVVALFLAGVMMSLLVVLPFTFPFLYGFAFPIGARPFLDLEEFLNFVLMFSLAFGLAFELPVVMYGLSYLGIVTADFWKKNWRIATIAIFVFGAAITPDGSGVTMMLVALPMLFLYVGGYAAIAQRERRRRRPKSS